MVAELPGEALRALTAPLWMPLWRLLVAASWPWPLLLVLMSGAAAAAVYGMWGLLAARWEEPAGVWLFLGGTAVMLVSPFYWRDARQERARRR
jgi:membrane protein implicated in regulation of membrane protease activity